jgi:large subunit ribosomal protein L24e
MKCSFCESAIKPGTGKIYVKKDGKLFNFCKMKCEKNALKLKRRPVDFHWTRVSQKARKGASK